MVHEHVRSLSLQHPPGELEDEVEDEDARAAGGASPSGDSDSDGEGCSEMDVENRASSPRTAGPGLDDRDIGKDRDRDRGRDRRSDRGGDRDVDRKSLAPLATLDTLRAFLSHLMLQVRSLPAPKPMMLI